jgi:hypothetical protein
MMSVTYLVIVIEGFFRFFFLFSSNFIKIKSIRVYERQLYKKKE